MKPTPNGYCVRLRTDLICSRNQSGLLPAVPPMRPNPPASETAAANSAVAVPAIGALMIGCSMPNKSQMRVWISGGISNSVE